MLKQFCVQNDLKVIELFAYGGLREMIYDHTMKAITTSTVKGKRFYVFLWKTLYSVLSGTVLCKKISLQSRKNFPLGYILIARK